jgi:PAS domain S-box-containing protein
MDYMQKETYLQQLSYFTIKQSNVPVIWIDSEGTIQHLNEAACKFSGFDHDEIIGKKTYDFHPDENETTWREQWETLKKLRRQSFEKWQPHKDGKYLRVKVTQNLIEFEGESYTVSLIEDKTREYDMSEQIKENERRLSTLMSNLPGMAYRCKNDAKWTMEFVSQGCINLTGYNPTELLENNRIAYNDILMKEDRPRVKKEVEKQIEKEQSFEIKYRIQTKDKKIRWVWERGSGIKDKNGHITALEGFITDITKMKEAEQQLVEKEQAVRKLKNRLEEETVYLREEIKLNSNFEEIISKSEAFRKVLKQVEQVAATESTVLIQGETGTGKELIARALHNNSNRSKRSLVTVNCAAIPSEMIESELFGHEKGAFTGAYTKKIGRFELAHQGTLFLDEIGELPQNLQTKLLRVLQEGEFQRLGNPNTIKIDARVIAATNRNLQKAIRNGDFREDLYYRLNVFPIEVPPLRERKEDIPLLVRHFINKYSAKTGKQIKETSQKVMKQLIEYNWPGNIRELENIIERAVIICDGNRITMGSWIPENHTGEDKTLLTLEENERQHIIRALKTTNWRISGEKGAAKLLGMKRTTLQARMKKLGIERPEQEHY